MADNAKLRRAANDSGALTFNSRPKGKPMTISVLLTEIDNIRQGFDKFMHIDACREADSELSLLQDRIRDEGVMPDHEAKARATEARMQPRRP